MVVWKDAGPAEVGVEGVPGHTQYLPPHLVKTIFRAEKFDLCNNGLNSFLKASFGPEVHTK